MPHVINKQKSSRTGLRVEAIYRRPRRAINQLMRVPWPRFRKAYEKYPQWRALVLWVQAVIATQDSVPPWLIDDLRKRCPGFIESEPTWSKPEAVDFHLSEWIHNHEFEAAKRQGWLDALTFYGVRHPLSECAWAYWEHCENQWLNMRPDRFPSFEEWWSEVQHMMLRDELSFHRLNKMLQRYLESEALVLWLRPLLISDIKLPRHVISELERRCPGVLGPQNSAKRCAEVENSAIWCRLVKWRKDFCLSQVLKADWLDLFLQRAQSHPSHVRLVSFGKHWAGGRSQNPGRSYPSFREWRLAADRYVVKLRVH